MYNPIVDEKARGKLKSHIRFLKNVNEFAAEKFYVEYKQNLIKLAENPHNSLKYEHKKNQNLKYKLFYKNRFRIVFEIIENNVYILDIQDCRQDSDKNII